MTTRLTTDDELIAYCANGSERVGTAITQGDPDVLTEVLTAVLGSRTAMLGTYATWTAHTMHFLAGRMNPEDLTPWMRFERDVVVSERNGLDRPRAERVLAMLADPEALAAELTELLRAARPDEARSRWHQIDAANLAAHQHRRDVLTSWWSDVYEAWGATGLSELMTELGNAPGWRDFLTSSLAAPIEEQVRDFAYILTVGNYGSASIAEHEDRFELRYNVCGSCGLQELAGRFDGPDGYARTTTELPGFDSGDPATTVYRTHQAMLHAVAAIDVAGQPYPVISCDGPGGRQGCRFTFFKGATPAEHFERVGRTRPAGS